MEALPSLRASFGTKIQLPRPTPRIAFSSSASFVLKPYHPSEGLSSLVLFKKPNLAARPIKITSGIAATAANAKPQNEGREKESLISGTLNMGLMMSFSVLSNSIIPWVFKDVLAVKSTASTAGIISSKTLLDLSVPFGLMFMSLKFADFLSKQALLTLRKRQVVPLFYTVFVPFIAFSGAFGFVLYPLSNYTALADKLLVTLGPHFRGPLAIFRSGRFGLLDVMTQLEGGVVISALFWGFANEITGEEAKRFYPVFGLGANVAIVFFGQTVKCFYNLRKNLGPGIDGWALSPNAIIVVLVVFGICVRGWWMNNNVPHLTCIKKEICCQEGLSLDIFVNCNCEIMVNPLILPRKYKGSGKAIQRKTTRTGHKRYHRNEAHRFKSNFRKGTRATPRKAGGSGSK